MRVVLRRTALLLATSLWTIWSPSPLPAQERPAVQLFLDSLVRYGATANRPLFRALRRVYADQAFAPLWLDRGAWSPRGREVQDRLSRAADDGLEAPHYPVPSLDDATPAARARADVRLSLSIIRYAQDVGWGLTVPGAVHRSAHFVPRPFHGDSVLARVVAAPSPGSVLDSLAPQTIGYRSLRRALASLTRAQASGGWSAPATGGTLRLGDRGVRVQELRTLLRERGDLPIPSSSDTPDARDLFDLHLAAAVARFQSRHGLAPDSVFGPATRRELAVPLQRRREQVALGMERIRWLPPTPPGRWIAVNLADYQAFLFEDSTPVFTSRVVVGATNHQTPMFIDTMTNVVLNPWWNVPPSIERAEIRPAIRRTPDYLVRNHMIRVDGGIRQLPGPWNALGQVAFMFPNAHNVYMHDTPAKALFALPDRAHSHGCIRVARPRELAEILLAPEGWSAARIDSVIASGTRTVVPLRQGIPVRISYATAFPGADGAVHFRRDVYGRDAALRRAIAQYHAHDGDPREEF
ncbi:L,D-transpeptidase family protein [Gemmatimonas phototrophica]|uniref:L,D-transpeptidase family protein n=1 Tax=Gemmatimonas phototrophica TaxID=1379270 RepID=UPI0006A726B4|nr:L,D-transpeptidase family protein [Gemmatimonas phototrophica]